jgi:hypothetical protein
VQALDVVDDVRRLREALQRPIETDEFGYPGKLVMRVAQRCPICAIELGLQLRTEEEHVTRAWLRSELFAVYDNHRCQQALADALRHATPARLQELYERTEHESIRMAERAQVLTDAELRARAEYESSTLLAWAEALKARIASW